MRSGYIRFHSYWRLHPPEYRVHYWHDRQYTGARYLMVSIWKWRWTCCLYRLRRQERPEG